MTAAEGDAGGAEATARAGVGDAVLRRRWNVVRGRGPRLALALTPGALTVYLAFHAGGYFPGTQAAVTVLLLLAIAVRVLFVKHPGPGLAPGLVVAVVALGLFALWTLLSGAWSDAPARALVEFDRALLYLLVLVLFGIVGRETVSLRSMVRGVALAAFVVCGIGLLTRVLPDAFPIAPQLYARLNYPLTYWNAFGLLAAIGAILCFGLTSSEREPPAVRVLAAAALPVLCATLPLTLSRGAIGAAALGICVFVVVGHTRGLLAGAIATVPATAIAVIAAYDADLLVSDHPLTSAAQAQGHHVATVVGLCCAGAALLRAALLFCDRALARARPSVGQRRAVLGAGAVLVAAALVAAAVAGDVAHQYSVFTSSTPPRALAQTQADPRARLENAYATGRIEQWRVSLQAFDDHPVRGTGAGTYELTWQQRRPDDGTVTQGHSLYLEVMGELGLVGLVLVVTALLAILAAIARLARVGDRALHATILAAAVAWVCAAGIDWHWEMPAVTVWLFALGGTALAAPRASGQTSRVLALVPRIAIAIACCVLLMLVPARLATSQDALDSAAAGLRADDCKAVASATADAIRILDSRPQAWVFRATCLLREGDDAGAVAAMRSAVARDPHSWLPRYGLAVALARSDKDPRPALRAAHALNPLSTLPTDALTAFDRVAARDAWRATARRLGIVIVLPSL